jgi:hypothetical protein
MSHTRLLTLFCLATLVTALAARGAASAAEPGTPGLRVPSEVGYQEAPLVQPEASGTNIITTVDSAGDVGQYTSVTIGADGLPLISYYDAEFGGLKAAHCADATCTSAERTTVDSDGDVGQYTSVTVGADGLPLISYYDAEFGGLKAAHCADATCTSATISEHDAAWVKGRYTSLTIGADGLPLISYFAVVYGDLKAAHCEDAACTSATLTTVDSDGDVGWYTSVAIGADGLPLIGYYDNTNGDLKAAHCNDAACASATLSTLDSGGDIGQYTSVTIGADSLPLISYYDVTNGDLKAAHCNDAACASATLTTLDSGGDIGQYTSVTIGSDGLPLISYWDGTNNDLKVAHCSDAACTAATLTTVDSAGDVGWFTSVTIGADHLPLIGYYDITNGDLKVAHCANAFCDDIAPDTTIDSQPANPTNSTSAVFIFSGTDTGTGVTGFDCALDAAAFAACTSAQVYTGLAAGGHTFQVRAIDAAGNADPTPASYTWTIPALALETSTPLFCVGENSTIDLKLYNITGLYGYQFEVTYDAAKVSAAGAFVNGFFDTTTNAYSDPAWRAVCTAGICKFSVVKTKPGVAVSGSGTLANVVFTGVAPGSFDVTIASDAILTDRDGELLARTLAAPLPLKVCGWTTVSGRVTMQGRSSGNVNAGTVTLTDLGANFPPTSGPFSATDGAFSLSVPVMPTGSSYQMDAAHSLYLTNRKTPVALTDGVPLANQNTRLWGGDAYVDGAVKLNDLSCIGGSFGLLPVSDCGGHGSADINADGKVNVQDLAIAGGNLDKPVPPATTMPW